MNSSPSSFSEAPPRRRTATLIVVPTKHAISACLEQELLRLHRRHTLQHVALSGGSLPSLLQPAMHPEFQWHVYLADERCVPSTHPDSNLGALLLRDCLTQIPSDHIHGINESLLQDPEACALDYEQNVLQPHLRSSPNAGGLDLALLGFGEDGHTCSLFPNHTLVVNDPPQRVAAILDSPKPPSHRVTLTLRALAETQHVIFIGAGASKAPILQQVFAGNDVQWESTEMEGGGGGVRRGTVQMCDPAPFPCGAVSPQQSLLWIVDAEAFPKA